ncbi:hypothetical protein [Mycobacterium sp. URHB0044]|uniref:hypothetical protein n=1 Tax=Mycobacterium sp. URHB0044 TaxID=1380386 RepID=UPI0012DFE11A|nr:hypothetical protein [Mycobacterium sp. URHB0044]
MSDIDQHSADPLAALDGQRQQQRPHIANGDRLQRRWRRFGVACQVVHGSHDGAASPPTVTQVFVGAEHPARQQGGGDFGP